MKKPIKIGEKTYASKKEALAHYKKILNTYNFGQSLLGEDYNDLLNLLDFDYYNYLASAVEYEQETVEIENDEENFQQSENGFFIKDIKVSKVQFSTKCFEVFSIDGSQYISYLMIINNKKYTPERLFYTACRNVVHADIMAVKQQYFKNNSVKSLVKCQETSKLSTWNELVVDHRQPNTFSIIVDRFKEVSQIVMSEIDYTSNAQNMIIFKDDTLTQKFREYHRGKATLRIVRSECNASRTGLARVKSSNKDLAIKSTDQLSLF
ncbi:DUF3223 domain-containing protein [Hymenobacter sp. H14-R3]|uniref:DUF3223 domain-containing protein n=1 Tax=Hymenobacter sp. H14-R3 TaxID=3046308 RepID=UPI0024BB6280|nr:DUF3223 domain-containing protein [Hymenobacter sp. H14-R3]MDJ0365870.1 DUF3223 domain-containing protein [Hymenobacter sp. H14-R3]